jgi:threonine dehydrogenase-like Zn-dependent dehydrogenase
VAVVDLDEPPGSGELLEMRSTSVCASDLLYIRVGSRRILGHELAGVRADGTAVAVEAMYGCMECEQCLRGLYNLCPTHSQRALGVTTDGGMAEQFRAPAARLVELPQGLDVRDAPIVEPASVSWHALNLAETGPGKRVAVVGAGALGLLAVAGARRMGADDVALEARRRRAELLGHPTIGCHPEGPLAVGRAEVVQATQALLALHAAVHGLDHDGGAVGPYTGQFVAEDPSAPDTDVQEV